MSQIVPLRKLVEIPKEGVEITHGPFRPAEVYEGETISATLTFPNGNGTSYNLQAYRISPLGVELIQPSDPVFRSQISVGKEIDLIVKIGKQNCEYSGLVVATLHKENHKDLLGVRWFQKDIRGSVETDRRKSHRWLCGDDFLPTGIAPSPVRFNDFIHFRVVDISKDGMQLATSLRNKHLIPGMHIEAMISFPLTGQLSVPFKVINTRIKSIQGRDFLALGVNFLDADDRTLETIGQYVLQFGPPTSVADLKKQGIVVRNTNSALEFGFVKSAEDYREVLHLRREAYSAVGKMSAEASLEKCGDIFDSRARILTVRHRGLLVGSVRLMFHNPEDLLEHEQFTVLPKDFPRKDELVEVTRVCTHEDYRGADLFYALMKHLALTVAQSKRRWILGSATKKLTPLYKKIGYQNTSSYYTHADLGNEKHELLLMDVPAVLSGVGVGPVLWNALYEDISDYLRDQNGFDFDPLMNLRMSLYRAINPFAKLVSTRILNPKKK